MATDSPRRAGLIRGGSARRGRAAAVGGLAWPAARDRSQSPFAQGLRRLRQNRIALVGAAIVALLLVVATFADVLAPQSPTASDQTQTFQRPSWDHPLGTDQLGRDMLSRIIHGTRISLAVGVSSVLLALFVGVPLGMIAGYHGGPHRHADHAGDGPDPRLPDLPAGHHPDGDLHARRRGSSAP